MKVDPGAAPGQPQASGTDAGSSPAAGAYPLRRRTHSRSVHAPPHAMGSSSWRRRYVFNAPIVASLIAITRSPASVAQYRVAHRSRVDSQETRRRAGGPEGVKGPGRTAASRVRGEARSRTAAKPIAARTWLPSTQENPDDLPGSHPRGQVVQDVVDGDARADEARLSAPHSRPISIIDVRSISPKVTPAEPGGAQTGPSGSGRLKMSSHRELRHPLEPPGKAVPWSRVDHGCWRTSHWL